MTDQVKFYDWSLIHLSCIRWWQVAHLGTSAAKRGAIFALIAVIYLWRTEGLGTLWSRADAVFFAFGLGFVLRVVESSVGREVVIDEEGIATTVGAACPKRYARSAVREIVVERLAKDRIAMEVRWTERKQRPLRFCTRTDKIEGTLEWLVATYPVRFRDIPGH